LENCKDRYLYKIVSRNFGLGVFDAKNRDFIGIRNKCGDTFLDRENYTIGCVKVLEEIEKIPDNIELTVGGFSDTLKQHYTVFGKKSVGPLWLDNIDLFNYLSGINDEHKSP
jgi:hypothetical protein